MNKQFCTRMYYISLFSLLAAFAAQANIRNSSDNSHLGDPLLSRGIAQDLTDQLLDVGYKLFTADKTLKKVKKGVDVIGEDADEILEITQSIESKVCQNESEIDDLSDLSLSILDKACDVQLSANDTFEKECDTNSRVEVIESKVDAITGMDIQELQESVNDALEKECDTNSRVEVIESKVDVIIGMDIQELQESVNDILEKACDTNSNVDVIESKIDLHEESLCEKMEQIQESINDTLEKLCDVQPSVNDTLDKACVLDSKIDVIGSKIDEISGSACEPVPFFAAGTISTSGIYCLANDISGTITIDADNVTLDLNQYMVSGGTTDNIVISNNVVDVIIQNGVIGGGAVEGITISSGTRNIKIIHVDFMGGTRAINAAGFSIFVSECTFRDYINGAVTQVVSFDGVEVGQINDCVFSENSTGARILTIDNSSCVTVKDVVICNNSNENGLIGILGESIHDSRFVNCTVDANSTAAGEIYGIELINSSTCTIKSCQINGNEGPSTVGGILLSSVASIVVDSCLIAGNNSTAGTTLGIRFNGANDCCILNNIINSNFGVVSSGVFLDAGMNNAIFSNKVQGHGTFNYFGLPSGAPIAEYDISGASFVDTPSPSSNFHNLSVIP